MSGKIVIMWIGLGALFLFLVLLIVQAGGWIVGLASNS